MDRTIEQYKDLSDLERLRSLERGIIKLKILNDLLQIIEICSLALSKLVMCSFIYIGRKYKLTRFPT